METTQRTTAVKYSRDPLPESTLELETEEPTLTSNDKKAAVDVWSAAYVIRGCLMMITLAFQILAIIISLHFQGRCPIQPKIPLFLYVSGIIGVIRRICSLLIPVVGFIIQVKKSLKSGKRERVPITINVKLLAIIGIVTLLLNVADFIWFICGTFWTFGVFSRVSYNINDHGRYCSRVLYVFTFILLVLGLIQIVGHCLSAGLGTKRRRRDKTTRK